MLQRSRLIVPLDEVSHQGGGVDGGMYPFGARRPRFRGEGRVWDDLGRFPGRRLLRPGRKGRRGQGGGAGEGHALQEIAPTDNRLIKEFFTHLLLPCRDRQENRSAAQVAPAWSR